MATKRMQISPRVAAFNKHRLSLQPRASSASSPTSSHEHGALLLKNKASKASDIYTVR